jgi:hypothetical protein
MACAAAFVLPLWLLSSPLRHGLLTTLLAGLWVLLAVGMLVTAWWPRGRGFRTARICAR